MSAAANRISRAELLNLVGDELKVDAILEVVKDITRYAFYKHALNIGITFRQNDVSFHDVMIFSWIKEAEKGK